MLTYITSHVDSAVQRLFFQFRHKPRWVALVTSLAIGVQNLENTAYATAVVFDRDSAKGEVLDMLGAVVGAPREGATDIEYRRAIRAKIQANRSHGTVNEVYGVIGTAVIDPSADGDSVAVTERYPQLLDILVTTERELSTEERARIRRLASLAKAGGVSLRMIRSAPDALAFHARGSGEQTFDGPEFGSYV